MSLLHHDDPKIARLRKIDLFADAETTALRHLASAADEVTVPAGTTLITEGHRHTEGYLIISGTVAVTVEGAEVAQIGDGEMIGELALFGHGPASANVAAKTEVTVLVIPYNRFDQILDENPALTKQIARQLAGRLHAMDDRLRAEDS